jgi:protein-S-isoprenylcysteine O-methyltransferase Ste14
VPRWNLSEALGTLVRPEMTRMVLYIYMPILIPITLALNLLGRWLDARIGWPLLPGPPVNLILCLLFLVPGLAIVWWCYSYLIIEGQGGPAPLVAPQPTRLVVRGPYGLSRHPSIPGKFLGTLGVGFLFRSPTFVLIILPLLLVGSLLQKWYFMERNESGNFGTMYQEYKRQVPFMIPRMAAIRRMLRGQDPVCLTLAAEPPAAESRDSTARS